MRRVRPNPLVQLPLVAEIPVRGRADPKGRARAKFRRFRDEELPSEEGIEMYEMPHNQRFTEAEVIEDEEHSMRANFISKPGFVLNTDKPTKNDRGFQLAFKNGYVISVQWGVGSYADRKQSEAYSSTAEIAVFRQTDGEWVRLAAHDDVLGYRSPEEVARYIALTASIPPGTSPEDVAFFVAPVGYDDDDDDEPFELPD